MDKRGYPARGVYHTRLSGTNSLLYKQFTMAYEYDIFLSYNRQHPHGTWVNEVLYPLLIPYVQDALNRNIRVFKDDREILTGAEWERTIMKALLNSRVMVAVLSPTYFLSEWCRREFQTIHYR